ncbi:FkbM family methyltransferase [Calothrix sp. FACHB-156]|nr:FkbM family methyltransferase [Calothrix sp. FACHB-156]
MKNDKNGTFNYKKIIHIIKSKLPRNLYLKLRALIYGKKKTISQIGQDFWVFGEVFNEKQEGFFVEIGAADGITLSNTFLLEKKYNWRGVCIEADPLQFRDLVRIRNNASCYNVCVDAEEKTVEFVSDGLFGGIVDSETDNKNANTRNTFKIETVKLLSILKAVGAPKSIDYLSIDIEGAEDRVLCDFPFHEYCFKSLTIERPKEKLKQILAVNDYILIKQTGLDAFYIHKSFLDDYTKNMLCFWQKMSVST